MQDENRNEEMPPAVILCGGRGTRLMEVTELLPKPMVEIGGAADHLAYHALFCGVRSQALHSLSRLQKEKFIDYFVNYHIRTTDVTIRLGHDPGILYHGSSEADDWQVTLAGTGLDSMTGCRVYRASRYLKESDREFFLTYGDGLADINIADLLSFHRKHGKLLTCSAVHPASRFGAMNIVDGTGPRIRGKTGETGGLHQRGIHGGEPGVHPALSFGGCVAEL